MKKHSPCLRAFLCLLGLSCLLLPVSASAQSSRSDSIALVAHLRDSVEAHPEDSGAHRAYIKEVTLKNPALAGQYDSWMKKFPASTTVPFMIGEAYWNAERPQATPYLNKVVAMNPTLALAWFMLSIDAKRWGDEALSGQYMGHAAQAAPTDPAYAFYYAMTFEESDPKEWRRLIYDLARRFPQNDRAAQGLYWLANRSQEPREKVHVYEMLRTNYPPGNSIWSAAGMEELFDCYMLDNPRQALGLARQMTGLEGWEDRETMALQVLSADSLLNEHKYTQALQATLGIKLSSYSKLREYVSFLQAKILSAFGDTQAAYDTLLNACAKEPTDSLYAGLKKYGASLSRNPDAVEKDIRKVRAASATKAPSFSLGLYTEKKDVSLEDYKGKVVLLTFWFPGCGPCRGEFPHFQHVLDKFAGQPIVYLAINVLPNQDEYVLPFMKSTKYSFIPLRGSADFAEKVYGVRSEPTNFLIDQDGNILFKKFRTDASNERTLELMIGSMLNR